MPDDDLVTRPLALPADVWAVLDGVAAASDMTTDEVVIALIVGGTMRLRDETRLDEVVILDEQDRRGSMARQ